MGSESSKRAYLNTTERTPLLGDPERAAGNEDRTTGDVPSQPKKPWFASRTVGIVVSFLLMAVFIIGLVYFGRALSNILTAL